MLQASPARHSGEALAKLYTRQVEPVVGEVERRFHQRRPDASAPPVIANDHPDLAGVPPAPVGGIGIRVNKASASCYAKVARASM